MGQSASVPRILYMQPSTTFGGAERQAATALPRLPAHGVDVTALVGPGDTIATWLQQAGVSDVILEPGFPRDWAETRGWRRARLLAAMPSGLRKLSRTVDRLLAAGDIDLVFAAMPYSWIAAAGPARRHGVPVIWRSGGMELTGPQKVLLRLFARLSPPDLLICNGESVRGLFGPLIPAPSVVVGNGVDRRLFFPGAADPRLVRPPGARAVVGFAGRLVPQKRPQDFLAMAAALRTRHPGTVFMLAGDSQRRGEYQTLARSLGLGDSVRFLGYLPDMRAFYAACDVLVLPSRSEGCPNVVLEAMAMGRVVVASDAPATAEVLTPLREGMTFPVGDVERLAAVVGLLLDAPALRANLGARALERVAREFDADLAAAKLADVVRRQLAAPPTHVEPEPARQLA